MPGWANSDRRERLPANWVSLRKQRFKFDGHQCTAIVNGVRCPEPAEECDHHVRGDDHRLENLRSMCSWHHAKKSSAEGAQARAAKWRKNNSKFRRSEAHPGLV